MQFPNSICFFHVPYLFLCVRNINPEKKSLESLYTSLYFLLNGIFTVICIVFDTKRQRRMDFFYVIATVLLVISGIKIIILLFGCCWQNRFNSKISIGQIPQYDFVSSEKNNTNNTNINRYIIFNRKIEKNSKINNDNKLRKINKKIQEKEYSSQANIREQNNLSLIYNIKN